MTKRIKIQKLKEIKSNKDSSRGEHSPYWDYARAHESIAGSHSPDGVGMRENSSANPDVLPETEIAALSTPQLLMGEAVQHLQGRQREVYLLTMREDKSLAEVAEILSIEKGTAQKYRERAIKFIESYCRQAIARGRV